MNRRRFVVACAVPVVTLAAELGRTATPPKKETPMSPFQPLFEKSLAEKKGLSLWVAGQSIALVVTKIAEGSIEGKNRELATIIVRVDRIDAAGIS